MVKKFAPYVALVIGLTLAAIWFLRIGQGKSSAPGSGVPVQPQSSQSPSAGFDKKRYPIDEAGSIWWIVSKVRSLDPVDYAPGDLVTPQVPLRVSAGDSEMRLRKEAAGALETMARKAKSDGINLMLASGYRSYQLQIAVYNANVQKYGQAGADKQSARPGTSEHQTGLAADLEPTSRKCEVEDCFADLPEGKWLAAHAYEYGFIVRYVEGKEAVTGYQYEPWHIRYVGKDLADEMHRTGTLTLEEFFGVVPASQPY